MTPAQRDRLPGVLREIVDVDRELAMARSPLVHLLAYAEIRKRRRELTAHAAKLWGHSARGDQAHA
jgi:hypothetical protein